MKGASMAPPTLVDDKNKPPTTSWWPMCFVGIAQLMVMLDSTVVNVALPSIGKQLPADSAALQWTISIYVLVYGSLLLLGGRVADVMGRRRSFIAGLIFFAGASIACGISTNAVTLVLARALQGLGAAILSAAALSIVVSVYQDPKQRKIALTAWSSLGVLGATVGVVLGGIMVTSLSWRWAFFINVPLALIALFGTLKTVPRLKPTGRRALRIPSAIIATSGLALLSFGLIQLQDGFSSISAWASLAISLVLLFVLARMEISNTDPLLPLQLLKLRTYLLSSIGLLLAAAVMISGSYIGSQYFQNVHGTSALKAGLALLPMGLSSLFVAFAVPKLIGKIGPAFVYLIGSFAQIIGAAMLSTNLSSIFLAIIALAIIGAGLPSSFVPLYSVGTSHVRPEDSGVGSGLLNTFNQTGAALGIAIVGTVLTIATTNSIHQGQNISQATSTGVAHAFIVVAVCGLLGAINAFAMRRQLHIENVTDKEIANG